MMRTFHTITAAAIVAVLSTPAPAAENAEAAAEAAVFKMREVRVFSEAFSKRQPNAAYRLVMGQYAQCETEPSEKVKAYPELKSKKPLYGAVTFAREISRPGSGVEYYFVIDESGGPPPGDEGGDAVDTAVDETPAAEGRSLLESLVTALSGEEEPSRPSMARLMGTYDRLYFDLNRDLDLTNDPVLGPMKGPPAKALPQRSVEQWSVFDHLRVPFDHGAEAGTRPFELLPRLEVSEYEDVEYAMMYFASTVARRGDIRIGSRRYDAVLGQPFLISGRFDLPYTALYLTPLEPNRQPERWSGAEELGGMRKVDGVWYTISSTLIGDCLIVSPYEGEIGVLEMGPGGTDIEDVTVSGSLRSKQTAVPLGTFSDESRMMEEKKSCRLPVGDYMPNMVWIQYGRLRLFVSHNYHSDGQPMDRERSHVYGIKIRKDKPFVWDFSNTPEVMFATPAKDATFTPGDEIEVKAVLTDPVLDFMIRGLDDTSRKEQHTAEYGDGPTSTYERNVSLDPIVTITNSRGEQLGQGKMPFG
ncbi:MAG: hypothetical protein ACYTG0_24245 [Planctomycetota bacterium]|jgi:hypothetical protein